MRRRYYYIAGTSIILILSYLFYQSCRRDTFVSGKKNTIGIPDSSWLAASINLNSIRSEIAWNTLLNGNFSLLFKTDSVNNTLFQLLGSPSDFDVSEQLPIYYFSKWEDDTPYHGLILSLEHAAKLHAQIGGNLIPSEITQTYISRSKEGIWIYNDQNLMFLFMAEQDSVTALKYFKSIIHSSLPFNESDSITVSVHMNTSYIPSKYCHPALDSLLLSMQILTKEKSIHTYWSYNGIFDNYAENTELKEARKNTGIYYSAKHTPYSFQTLKSTFPSIDSLYQKNKELFDHLVKVTDHNVIQASFNGWQQIKNSYYVSEMNDEFEVVLKKKDTSFTEPVFYIQLEQKNAADQQIFITYLEQQGLITYSDNFSYKVIPGNFDSELIASSNKGIILQNKHMKHPETESAYVNASFLFDIHSDAIQDADALAEIHPSLFTFYAWIFKTEQIRIQGRHSAAGMNGELSIRFKEEEHPFIQIMKLLSERDGSHNEVR